MSRVNVSIVYSARNMDCNVRMSIVGDNDARCNMFNINILRMVIVSACVNVTTENYHQITYIHALAK